MTDANHALRTADKKNNQNNNNKNVWKGTGKQASVCSIINTAGLVPVIIFLAGCDECVDEIRDGKKTGELSCCSEGGSWYNECGTRNDPKPHTWREGVTACSGIRSFQVNSWCPYVICVVATLRFYYLLVLVPTRCQT